MRIRIGTRGSGLARAQAEEVAGLLKRTDPSIEIEMIVVATAGDRDRVRPLPDIGGSGLFTKALEEALLERGIDLAVHSLKDLPLDLAPGLAIAAIPGREDVRDALVSRGGVPLDRLPAGARIGTSSPRREFQLRALARSRGREDIRVVPIRGNVETRIRKAESGEVDAVVLALAGLGRLGLEPKAAQAFPLDEILPAPGQGALALEARETDVQLLALASALDDPASRDCVFAERAVLRCLGGGCHLALAAYAELRPPTRIRVRAAIEQANQVHRAEAEGALEAAPDRAGWAVGQRLKSAAGIP